MDFNQDSLKDEGSRSPYLTRSTLLSVLCVLTFIGSGISAISYLWIGLTLDSVRQMVFESGLYDAYFNAIPSARASLETTFALPRYYFILSGVFYICSVVGAALMWKLRRPGFHVYTISQCALIIFGMLMIPSAGIPWGGIMWTAIFVVLYAMQLKSMNK